MHCPSWGREAPSDKARESLDWAALGLADQGVCRPAHLSDPQQRATPVISAAAWLGQWAEHIVRDHRRHHLTKQRGLQPGKSRHRDAHDSSRYGLAPAKQDSASRSGNLPVNPAEAITLNEDKKYLGAIRAEIMEYLRQTYGPMFVEDLIKHLPQPR